MSIRVESSAFKPNERVPALYSGDGKDISPPLSWSGVPAAAQEVAMICDDPDAPTPKPWVHWVIAKISPGVGGLPENVAKSEHPGGALGDAVQGRNSWDRVGYGGPAPPKGHGTHHYHFKLYALDVALDAKAARDKEALLAAMRGHILAEGELIGTYSR